MAERLYRSRRKKMIGGVSAGLGEYINVDPVLIRVLFVIFTIINPLTLLAYIILWIVVEEEPYEKPAFEMNSSYSTGAESKTESSFEEQNASETEQTTEIKKEKDGRGRTIAGIILIAIGLVFLADEWFPTFDFVDIFPYALVAGGLWLVIKSKNKKEK